MITASANWKSSFPGASFGIMVIEEVLNSAGNCLLEERKALLEEELRERHLGKSRKQIGQEPPFGAYEKYYRRFGQGYPVLHQVETVAVKGKPLFSPSPLVAAMFMAELKNGLLTAGHDLDKVSLPIFLDVSEGRETYQSMGGKTRNLLKGDMFLSDRNGILSSIIYGPDDSSAITSGTSRSLFTVYGVPSITSGQLRAHLEGIEEFVRIFCPEAIRRELLILD